MVRENVRRNSVAIIGMSCQFPGARDASSFWELIKANKPVIGLPPENRTDLHSHARAFNIQVKGGYIENYEDFDAGRFHIPEHDATMMDPQQKLVLTNVCNAIEDAGLNINDLKGDRTGVFVGAMANDLVGRPLETPDSRCILK
ncbi:beta-ketoacyl synthase N-terminal-like domain-containing protein (plasmid) [Enterobacter sp. JS8-1]|uniref:beta-ketoacyl synthase N-terminal-like domain-containing protein n=1 Tax=Enterobacter sp. JS8-1 TaxID=3411633 RepID=UPI003BA01741